MREVAFWRGLSRAELREHLRASLAAFGPSLRLVAEEMRGDDDAVIDWIAAERNGRVVVALMDPEDGDPALLGEGLAQRAWVAARVADWLKLAPGLGVRPELRPSLLLIAPHFSRKTRIAAREADPVGIWLARFVASGQRALELELIRKPELREAAPGATDAPARSQPLPPFRTGLTDEDLGLTRDERESLA